VTIAAGPLAVAGGSTLADAHDGTTARVAFCLAAMPASTRR
jgi:hypothetical protein